LIHLLAQKNSYKDSKTFIGSVRIVHNWGGLLTNFRTAIEENIDYIPMYPEFEKITILD